jgi:hypothetical protein
MKKWEMFLWVMLGTGLFAALAAMILWFFP